MTQRTLLYVADPMCSWCWGFWPVIESLQEHFSDLPVAVILGGLAPGAQAPMDERAKSVVREHWDHVHEATGQPFDYEFFKREGFSYTTEPPSRAVVAARRLDEDRAIRFFAHLQAAFYRDNQDVTDPEVLCDQAESFGFDRDEFARVFDSDTTHRETQRDFSLAREMGVSGFPCLLGHDGEKLTPLSVGYQPWGKVGRTLEAWLASSEKPDTIA